MVGALLLESERPDCECGVVFFNNVGTLHMCIHGTIGLAVTLAHLGRIGPGVHRIETPVGVVAAELHGGGEGERGQRSELAACGRGGGRGAGVGHGARRHRLGRQLVLPGRWPGAAGRAAADRGARVPSPGRSRRRWRRRGLPGRTGWRSITSSCSVRRRIRRRPTAAISCFVPGNAYDRSPCGTGTSAKLACLVAAGKLRAGRGLAAGGDPRLGVRGTGRGPGRRQGPADDHRLGLGDRRVGLSLRCGRSVRVRDHFTPTGRGALPALTPLFP